MSEAAAAPPTSWVISDGAAGNVRQATALAQAMGLAPIELHLRLRAPWRWFAPRLLHGAQHAFVPAPRPPWPALAIGCGRHAALLTRALRAWSGGATFTVQILDPRIKPDAFDVLVAPRHDACSGDNVISTLGALNAVDADWLARARAEFGHLLRLPAPRTAVLVGGPRRGLGQDAAWLERFIARLQDLLTRDGGSLMIALSRRTPAPWRARLHGAFSSGCVQFWGGVQDGVNPYAGYLAHADRIVVTPDSVNMLSEACASTVPVLSELPAGASGRIAAFHAALRASGRLQDFDNVHNSTLPAAQPLRETAAVAAEIWRRYGARGAAPGAAAAD